MSCRLCDIDKHECPPEERAAAFFVLGMVHDDLPDACMKHSKWMITGAAVIAAARLGSEDGIVKELRRIATNEPLRLVPPASLDGGKADGAK